jgi:lysophospholipase L1-like esterase
MQARKGSAGLFRIRGRLIGCVMMLALAAIVVVPAAASAAEENVAPAPAGPIYMALGDSISFGYSAQKFAENEPTESPSRFETGVANDLNRFLSKSIGKGLNLVNLACPGETSNGLIGENEALGGQKSTEEPSPPALYQGPGDWHPCAWHNVDGLPLHAGFGSLSQLEAAVSILTAENKITKKPNEVKMVTLNDGNNDILGLVNQCTVEFGEAGATACFLSRVGATIHHVILNIEDTIKVIDEHYSGPVVLFAGYDPLAFVHPGFDQVAEGVNKDLKEEVAPKFANVTIANPFPVFNANAEKTAKGEVKEQKAICKYTEMCNPNVQAPGGKPTGKDGDIHPSAKGYKELAKLALEAYTANPAK